MLKLHGFAPLNFCQEEGDAFVRRIVVVDGRTLRGAPAVAHACVPQYGVHVVLRYAEVTIVRGSGQPSGALEYRMVCGSLFAFQHPKFTSCLSERVVG